MAGDRKQFHLVKAQPSDVEGIATLNRQFHLPVKNFIWDTPEWVDHEARTGSYYVARDEKGLAGALCLHFKRAVRNGVLEAIAVREDLHGQGIGRMMIKNAKDLCRRNGMKNLLVGSFHRYGLKEFYERCGFTCDPKPARYQGEKYHLFRMKIRP
jgi:GNAT superfamily N-acetyltransferase